jgi:outer membrane protein OmpA-like peptidoglycan-associated protein
VKQYFYRSRVMLLSAFALFSLNSCATMENLQGNRSQVISTAAGGVAGYATGDILGVNEHLKFMFSAIGAVTGFYYNSIYRQSKILHNYGGQVLAQGESLVIMVPSAVVFEPNKADFQYFAGSTRSVLNSVVSILSAYAGYNLSVSVNTNGIGSEKIQRHLSQARAKRMADYLRTRGMVAGGSLTYAGYADTQPMSLPNTSKGLLTNSRIQITVFMANYNPNNAARGWGFDNPKVTLTKQDKGWGFH